MDNYTVAPEDEYDIFIEDHLENSGLDQHHPELLSAQQVLQFCSTVFAVGLVNNILAVFILVKYKELKHAGNIYFLNLTVSNLCFLLPLPFWAHAVLQGESPRSSTCKVLIGTHSTSLYSEAFFNILLLLQGYQVFSHGRWLSSAPQKVTVGIVPSVLAWIVAILATLPEFVFYKPQLDRQSYTCAFARPHFLPIEEPFWKCVLTLKTNVLVLVSPLMVFIFCWMRMRKTRSFGERQYNLCRLASVIMGVFLLMWAPYNTVLFLSTFQEHLSLQDEKSSYNLDTSVQVTQMVATTHCCVNPLLYLFLDRNFRKYLCSLFPRCNESPFPSSGDSVQAAPRDSHDLSTEL
ncbi:C-C chemokine receptor-like 2 [Nannospalax galili]|uniref:C-C chemokine receptor-like 2 n=1 Tax=Nannospalax galili TaxID=1026970 RepID=UPI0004ED3AB0|nr:C-C chemokine receptor-like 2 [Nannospalax galili]